MEPSRLDAPADGDPPHAFVQELEHRLGRQPPGAGVDRRDDHVRPAVVAARRHDVTSASWSSCVQTMRSPGASPRQRVGEGQGHRRHVRPEPDATPAGASEQLPDGDAGLAWTSSHAADAA